jgi:hypothetical protein
MLKRRSFRIKGMSMTFNILTFGIEALNNLIKPEEEIYQRALLKGFVQKSFLI